MIYNRTYGGIVVLMKKWIVSLIGVIGMAIMIAFQMSLDIGLSPWDGLSLTVARLFNIKVGDMTLYLGVVAVLVQFLLLGKKFRWTHMFQLVVAIFMGQVINIFYYYLFSNLKINTYVVSLLLFVLSVIVFAFFVSLVQVADTINLPLEGMSQVLASKFKVKYSELRFGIDVVSLILIVVLVYVYSLPNTIREGTIISGLLFGPALGKIIPWIENRLID